MKLLFIIFLITTNVNGREEVDDDGFDGEPQDCIDDSETEACNDTCDENRECRRQAHDAECDEFCFGVCKYIADHTDAKCELNLAAAVAKDRDGDGDIHPVDDDKKDKKKKDEEEEKDDDDDDDDEDEGSDDDGGGGGGGGPLSSSSPDDDDDGGGGGLGGLGLAPAGPSAENAGPKKTAPQRRGPNGPRRMLAPMEASMFADYY